MMAELFAQDGYGGLSPLVQNQVAQAQRRQGGQQQRVQQPGAAMATPRSFIGPQRSPSGPGDPGTGAMQTTFNAAAGPYVNQRQSGMFDPSMWNTSLPGGDLVGSY
jgi:hypothetical protein